MKRVSPGFKTVFAVGLLLVSLGSAVPLAADTGAQSRFDALDQDADGQVTRAEMSARREARLAQIDQNGDGMLSAAEIEAHGMKRVKAHAATMIERRDSNGDGLLSQDELGEGRAGRLFDRADKDGDGVLSAEEFAQVPQKMRQRRSSDN
ncbi:MAG: hypothetical protein V2I76_04305 [Roseobacter sp.]|jgi:Ca2+-binding EF-hand superfamily protein|nr:hypothetical protein [Roseobacter sp.]